jgi:hypothetical protein
LLGTRLADERPALRNACRRQHPLASIVDYSFGQTRANNAILTLGPSGDFQIWCGQGSGTADVVVDVVGYFQ